MPWENDDYGGNDYWVDEDYDGNGYYDGFCDDEPDYDYAPWPDPDPTIIGRLKRFINRLRWRFYYWRHKEDVSDIPF